MKSKDGLFWAPSSAAPGIESTRMDSRRSTSVRMPAMGEATRTDSLQELVADVIQEFKRGQNLLVIPYSPGRQSLRPDAPREYESGGNAWPRGPRGGVAGKRGPLSCPAKGPHLLRAWPRSLNSIGSGKGRLPVRRPLGGHPAEGPSRLCR